MSNACEPTSESTERTIRRKTYKCDYSRTKFVACTFSLVSSDVGSSEIKLVHRNVGYHNFPQNTVFIEMVQIASGMSLLVPRKLLPN